MTPRLLWAVDPGKKKSAFASFRNGRLVGAEFNYVSLTGPTELAIEMPEHVHGSTAKDIILLARAAQSVIDACACKTTTYAPEKWKGSSAKPPHHRAILNALTAEERQALGNALMLPYAWIFLQVEAGCVMQSWSDKTKRYNWPEHNILDAVGIGLFHLGRIDKAGNQLL